MGSVLHRVCILSAALSCAQERAGTLAGFPFSGPLLTVELGSLVGVIGGATRLSVLSARTSSAVCSVGNSAVVSRLGADLGSSFTASGALGLV